MIFINYTKWLKKNTKSLSGKNVAVFGSTGGIGKELCRYILILGGTLIMVDRNPKKAKALREVLELEFKAPLIHSITADLENIDSVKSALVKLKEYDVDIIIHNAGAYSIPRKTCSTGYDNVFQINFLSPYYITKQLLPFLQEKKGKVIIVGSIAHNYSKSDINDIDFSTRKKPSLVYGNAKRYLMFSAMLLAKENPDVHFAVTHPGITFTNITAHYPKLIFAIIKHPMKIIFMPPKMAALNIIKGIFQKTKGFCWIGPRLFNVWGKPKIKSLKTCSENEAKQIFKTAENIMKEDF